MSNRPKTLGDLPFHIAVKRVIEYIRTLRSLKIGDVDGTEYISIDPANDQNVIDIYDSNSADATGPAVRFNRNRGGAIVQNNDVLLRLSGRGYDGANYISAAQVRAVVDGTPGTNDMPTRLEFLTTADGASSLSLHMKITEAGVTNIGDGGTTNYISFAANGFPTLYGTAKYTRHVQVAAQLVGAPANNPTPVDVGTAGGYQFASAGTQEELHFQWEVPDDWDGTDVRVEIDWLPDSGAMTNPDAVKWVFEYRFVAEGESIVNGTQASQSVTYDTTTAQYVTVHSPVDLPFNDANQPITAQDHLYVRCYRDTTVANDFAGTVVATAFEIIYTSKGLPTSN